MIPPILVHKNQELHILTPSILNHNIKELLDNNFSTLTVEGELSNVSKPRSGHIYFTLKDENAQIRCAMFKTKSQSLKFTPKDGDKVRVRARVGLYPTRGDLQLIIERMTAAGDGLLQQQFDALKSKLKAEGLFADTHKKAIPKQPNHLLVLSSATGAAIRDVLSIFERRYPLLRVTLLPVSVQGPGSVEGILSMLKLANTLPYGDLILITRGGGSLEDLESFNTEAVARAIHACRLPVVSAIGHEVDFTIADFVADLRAATPSAAAELITPDQQQLSLNLTTKLSRLKQNMQQIIDAHAQNCDHYANRIQSSHPKQNLNHQLQLCHQLANRLHKSLESKLNTKRDSFNQLNLRHKLASPSATLQRNQKTLDQHFQRLLRSKNLIFKTHRVELQRLSHQLNVVSPLSTLDRGYSITRNQQSEIVTSIKTLSPGQKLETQLSDGSLISNIIEVNSN